MPKRKSSKEFVASEPLENILEYATDDFESDEEDTRERLTHSRARRAEYLIYRRRYPEAIETLRKLPRESFVQAVMNGSRFENPLFELDRVGVKDAEIRELSVKLYLKRNGSLRDAIKYLATPRDALETLKNSADLREVLEILSDEGICTKSFGRTVAKQCGYSVCDIDQANPSGSKLKRFLVKEFESTR